MNIFWLEPTLEGSAKAMADEHVVKMSLEYAQILSTVHHHRLSKWQREVYRPTHRNHPVVVWACDRPCHYALLYQLWCHTAAEYTLRYGKVHKSFEVLHQVLRNIPADGKDYQFRRDHVAVPPICTNEAGEFRSPNWESVITGYRQYYSWKVDKGVIHYKRVSPPDWITVRSLIKERVRLNSKGV